MSVPYGAKFPQYIHLLPQFCFWEIDEIAIFFGFVFISWFMFKPACLLAPVVTYLYTRAKRRNPPGYMQHMMYCLGWTKFDGYPSYFEKHFHE
ncbi:hypothetical protein FO488_00380 [Geobacter sp. FeAm09]|uniref:type IV conjugative transfer system protein TraL n=1 Tax=Geobacter sp. FeAm09 TaxID=2597769 RepID=UPI0011EBB185|nr:type IV conjugative transfer system protein TraL [Geobacter sp. FeAm09]QEM66763.1 hypothetical protein FO488_00380 [Geobacter sp. FeAm09]